MAYVTRMPLSQWPNENYPAPKPSAEERKAEYTQAFLEDYHRIRPRSQYEFTNADGSDVINYVKATQYALDRLDTLPICNRLLRETHAVLMEGVRGQEKNPGEFRRSQNWIGPAGSTLKDARYIPPNTEDMEEAMSRLSTSTAAKALIR